MSIYKEQPHWMSDQQWALEQENTERHRRVETRGIGILQLSPKRYAVVRRSGTALSAENGQWWGHVHYDMIGEPMDWKRARALAHQLYLEAEAREAAK